MSNEKLQTIGDALVNIGGAIQECARQAGQGDTPPVDHFRQCVAKEVQRLHSVGEEALATTIDTIRSPLDRILTRGW